MKPSTNATATECACRERDQRVEYARATAARARMEVAITALAAARAEVSVTAGESHIATTSIAEALLGARRAAARLDIVVRYLGRIK